MLTEPRTMLTHESRLRHFDPNFEYIFVWLNLSFRVWRFLWRGLLNRSTFAVVLSFVCVDLHLGRALCVVAGVLKLTPRESNGLTTNFRCITRNNFWLSREIWFWKEKSSGIVHTSRTPLTWRVENFVNTKSNAINQAKKKKNANFQQLHES